MIFNIIVNQNEDYDIFLCFIEPSSIPRKGSKFIHRLDGIWFKPEEFNTHNTSIKWAYEKADHVIWQSNFDKMEGLPIFSLQILHLKILDKLFQLKQQTKNTSRTNY